MKNDKNSQAQDKLLSKHDPAPYEVLNATSEHPVLLVCEHAGQKIPQKLQNLGIDQNVLDSHVGWDIGAENVTRLIAKDLGATAILQRYSRLVIDCNRPPEAADAMPEVSDGFNIIGNHNLQASDRSARIDEIFTPYQNMVTQHILKAPKKLVLSIHSFTPSMNGIDRPWELGFLFRDHTHTSERLKSLMLELNPKLNIGMNEPYQIDNFSDWFVPQHGEFHDMPHSLVEIRNDKINDINGQKIWADYFTNIINRYLKEL